MALKPSAAETALPMDRELRSPNGCFNDAQLNLNRAQREATEAENPLPFPSICFLFLSPIGPFQRVARDSDRKKIFRLLSGDRLSSPVRTGARRR
jgi:hypothetical protein